jgi:hypothetical protein
VAIPPDYYLEPLEQVVAWVRRHHGALIDARLRGFLRSFERLPRPARRLLVRLLLRRGPDFRVDLLDYPEVGDASRAVLALMLSGLARPVPDPCRRLALLRMPELRRLLTEAEPGRVVSGRREELLACCVALPPTRPGSPLPQVIELTVGDGVDLLRLLYFGSLRQDLTEFILADIGTLRWQPVPLQPRLPWRSSEELRTSLGIRRACDRVRQLVEADAQDPVAADRLERMLEPVPRDRGALRGRERALLRLADLQARRGSPRRQLALLRRVDTPAAREAICRLLARRGRVAAAERLLQRMRSDSRDAAERHFAERFEPRRGRCRPQRRGRIRVDRWHLSRMPGLGVEQQVVAAHGRGGGLALHLENRLPAMLFALGFWDILFRPLPGAFVQPFQAGPLDLFEPGFRPRRAAAIDERLDRIGTGRYGIESFLDVIRRHAGTVNPFLRWWPTEIRVARLVLQSLSLPARRAICDRVADAPTRARSGFPDLTLVGGAPGCCEFVEVKGPGDQLRGEQRDWLEFLQQAGLPARVLEVRWA